MVVNENIILGSIIYTVKSIFGDNYMYYDETITEGFETPSFHIYKINSIATQGYTGTQYNMINKTYRYVIRYFTDKTNTIIQDINTKVDALDIDFKYINLIATEDEEEFLGRIRVNEKTSSINDGVLQYEFTFSTNVYIYDEKEKVKQLDLEIKNKEE